MTKKPMNARQRHLPAILPVMSALLFALPSQQLKAQPIYTNIEPMWWYAVRLTAGVQTSPPRINLNWLPDPDFKDLHITINGYTVFRKAKEATAWTQLAALNGSTTTFTDSNVSVGQAYEYSVVKRFTYAGNTNYYGDGYIFSGIQAALTENRGKLILLVESSVSDSLATELARLQADLVGDGWQVILHTVSSNDTPANAKALIVSDYNADPANVKAVFLLGHIPVLRSGNLDYDTHGARPLPADSYYGDMDGDWSGSPDYLPSDVELEVGRVDFFDMPGIGAPSPWPNETELLRNYLNKDHNWRFGLINVQRRALVADRFGTDEVTGETRASTGYRNFEAFLGHDKIVWDDCWNSNNVPNLWISLITSGSYLWTYACSGGQDNSIATTGFYGEDFETRSIDIVARDPKCVFFMMEGSHFGEWDHQDNLLRSVLAAPTMGLAVCGIAGHPHWYVHHMGLGETIGYGARLSMNNLTLYSSMSNNFQRAIYIALLGDPTLRMEPLAPPSGLSATAGATTVGLHWSASPDSVAGYHVYRADSAAGPFTRLTGTLVTGTSFTDNAPPAGSSTYMVRAVALQSNPSGSYFNPSQGIFASVSSTNPPTCTYALSATSLSITAAGGTGSVQVVTSAGCAWTAFSNDSWITVTSGATGTGNGTIRFLVSSNSGAVARTGTLGGTAGTFSITQNPADSGNQTNSIDEIKGTYTGLFYDTANLTHQSSGFFSATIGKDRRASVHLQAGGKAYSFSTTFNESGAATYTLSHGGTTVLKTDLQIGALGSDLLEGTVSGGTWTAALVANRSVFSAAHPCPYAGKYTFIIPGDTTGSPSVGDGYATVTVNSRGSVSVAGSLADGTRFTQSATVSGNGQWPLYVALYSRGSSILGWLTFANTTTDRLT